MNRLLSAPDPLVHSVLVALCDDDRVQARALKYLAELEDYATKIARGDDDDGGGDDVAGGHEKSGSSNPLKRKASMPAQLCIMCKRAFSPGDNSPTACLYHEGQLMLDESHEVWTDWDEEVGGPQITPENEEDYPQAFLWCKISLVAKGSFLYLLCVCIVSGTHLLTSAQLVVMRTAQNPGVSRDIISRSGKTHPNAFGSLSLQVSSLTRIGPLREEP